MFTTEFLVTSLIVALIPGAGVVFTVSTGLAQAPRASLFASFGCPLVKWKGVVICFVKQITTP